MSDKAYYTSDNCILLRADVLLDTLEQFLYELGDKLQPALCLKDFDNYLNIHTSLCEASYCGFIYVDNRTIFTLYRDTERQKVHNVAASRLNAATPSDIKILEINTLQFYSELIEQLEPYKQLDISYVLAGLALIEGKVKTVVRFTENSYPPIVNKTLH